MKKEKTKLNPENLRYLKTVGIIILAIVFYALINNLGPFFSVVSVILDALSPLLIGLCIAFMLNIPLKFFENRVFGKLTRNNGKVWSKAKRPICLVLSMIIVLSILIILLSFIIPQFISTCYQFFTDLPAYMEKATNTIRDFIVRFNLPIDLSTITIDWKSVSAWALDFFDANGQSLTQGALGIVTNIIGGAIDLLLGVIFSIYVLASKESLGKLGKGIIYAIFEKHVARKIISIAVMTNRAFTGFVAGQCVEVSIIGTLCFLGMLILGMSEHALLVSCIVAVTAFIPLFGPIIGAIMGALIILIVDPIMALWFLIFIILLQQIESHTVYPRIMGHHVDLPGILVITAVTIGGGLFGVLGIIFSVPLCSVIYTLLDQWMVNRLEKKNICHRSMSSDSAEPKKLTDECEICNFDSTTEDCNEKEADPTEE
jgi:predicted PurR-regulated permease PerM